MSEDCQTRLCPRWTQACAYCSVYDRNAAHVDTKIPEASGNGVVGAVALCGFNSEVLESVMKVTYDQEVDIVRIILSDADIEESDEDKPGIIIDYDDDGNVVGLEILDASSRMTNPRTLEYAVTG